jgi:hypothetical protein
MNSLDQQARAELTARLRNIYLSGGGVKQDKAKMLRLVKNSMAAREKEIKRLLSLIQDPDTEKTDLVDLAKRIKYWQELPPIDMTPYIDSKTRKPKMPKPKMPKPKMPKPKRQTKKQKEDAELDALMLGAEGRPLPPTPSESTYKQYLAQYKGVKKTDRMPYKDWKKGQKVKKKRVMAKGSSDGLQNYNERLRKFRSENPNISYRDSQKIVKCQRSTEKCKKIISMTKAKAKAEANSKKTKGGVFDDFGGGLDDFGGILDDYGGALAEYMNDEQY